tara:strand:+ start:2347 stop:3510 length:1164 start_codon:yes stop_codon:yes gene_type:complete
LKKQAKKTKREMVYSFRGSFGISLYDSEKTILPNGKVTRKCHRTSIHEECVCMLRNPITCDNWELHPLTYQKAFEGLFIGYDPRIGPVISATKSGKDGKKYMPMCLAAAQNSVKTDVLLFDCDCDGCIDTMCYRHEIDATLSSKGHKNDADGWANITACGHAARLFCSKTGHFSVVVPTDTDIAVCRVGALGSGNCVMGMTGRWELQVLHDFIPSDPFSHYDETVFAKWEQFQRTVPSPTRNQQTKMRGDIEQKLKRRAEIEDAVLIAREKQLVQEEEYLKNKRTAAIQRAAMRSQLHKERVEANNLKVAAREAQLAERKNHTIHKIPKAAPTASPGGKEFAKKKISIEQAQQHEHKLKEHEKQRVAKLEYMMHIVQIGDAIQHGDE